MTPLQDEIWAYLAERSWTNQAPDQLAKSVSLEAAELLEHFQWSSPSVEELLQDTTKAERVKRELADVLIYSLEFCIVLGVNFEDVIREKLEMARQKYPVQAVLNNPDRYFAIKEEFRANRVY